MPQRVKGSNIKATVTADQILDFVTEHNGARLTEIASELDVSKSSTHRHVNTLLELGYLVHENHVYKPGFRWFKYASVARSNFPCYDIAREELERMTNITNERSTLYIAQNQRLFEIYRTGGHSEMQPINGDKHSLYTTAPGKALLAHADWDDIRSRPAVDDDAVDTGALEEELRRIRIDGVCIDRNEANGTARVSSPVRKNGSPCASICISGPLPRLSGKRLTEDITGILKNTSKTIELQLLSA